MLVLAVLCAVINSVYLVIVSAGWINDKDKMSVSKYMSFVVPYLLSVMFAVWYLSTRIAITEVQ